MSLKEKGQKGVIWTLIDSVFLQGFNLITVIIMARLLEPEDFGLIGLITVFTTIGKAVVESGLGSSLIRDNEANNVDFSTIFYGNMGLSLFAYTVVYFSAPFISSYFDEFILIELLRVMGLTLILAGFSSIQQKLLIRSLNFKKLTILNLPSVFIGSALGIFLAIKGYGVWSLIARNLSIQVIKSIVFWFASNWKPSFVFDLTKFKFHFNFGYRLMISSVLNALFKEVYTLIIGKQFSISTLGFYNRAKTYNSLPIKIMSSTVSKSTYPLLSKIKDDKEKISKVYQDILRSIFFFTTPIMLTLAAVAKPLFLVLLTEKWLDSVPFFQIMAFSSILFPVHNFNLNVFKVFGRTDITLKLAVVKKFIIIGVIIIGVSFGIYGLLWGMVASSYLSLFINTYYSKDMIGYKTLDQIKDMSSSFLTGMLSAFIGYQGVEYFEYWHPLMQLVVFMPGIILLYVAINFMIKSKSYVAFMNYAKGILSMAITIIRK